MQMIVTCDSNTKYIPEQIYLKACWALYLASSSAQNSLSYAWENNGKWINQRLCTSCPRALRLCPPVIPHNVQWSCTISSAFFGLMIRFFYKRWELTASGKIRSSIQCCIVHDSPFTEKTHFKVLLYLHSLPTCRMIIEWWANTLVGEEIFRLLWGSHQ